MTSNETVADILDAARSEGLPPPGGGGGELVKAAREVDRWLLVIESAMRADAPRDHPAVLAALKALRAALRAALDAPSPGDREAVATLVMRWRCDMDDGDWPEDKAAAIVGYVKEPHHGDCTKHPMTCLRCEAEAAYRMADQIIALLSPSNPGKEGQ